MGELDGWKGCERPYRQVMAGRYVRLEPLDRKAHGDGLFAASSMSDADSRFRWLPEYAPASRQDFEPWLEKAEASADPMFFTVFDLASGRIAGRQTMMRIDAANGAVEIGNILWSAIMARRPAATEAFFLFARHVFDDLGYRRYEWKCNNLNEPSKRAALRFGMAAEGVFRQHMVVKGENRDTAWFSMIDTEWPLNRAAFEAWLDPANFDGEGQQRRRLEEIRAALAGQ